ncbi:MAG: glycosyltransferase [Nocardioidaceae bacterium]
MVAQLSVVVPFFNVERYIVACLESLRRQTYADLEVVLVDDGSQDGSHELAAAACAADPRFRMVRQENQGLGPARNAGVREAQGRYLAFVDSDDLVPRHAYERMVRALEASGSDFVAGDVRRFNDLGVRDSYVHRLPFAQQRLGTRVHDLPGLALDRMAWNKVYRRRFWDDHALEFPAMLYEDFPVSIRAHVRADAVDVLAAPVYYWRQRDGGDASITQRSAELDNLADRVTSAVMVLDLLAREAPALLPVVEQHLLHIDVSALAAAAVAADDASREAVLAHADRLLGRISPSARAAVDAFERVQNHLLEQRRVADLAELFAHRRTLGANPPVRRGGVLGRSFYHQLPAFGGRGPRIPRRLYAARPDELSLDAGVRASGWEAGRLLVDLEVAVSHHALDKDTRLSVWLQHRSGRPGRRAQLPVVGSPRFADGSCRLRVLVDPAELSAEGAAPAQGHWLMMVRARCRDVDRSGPVQRVHPGPARWPALQPVGDGWAQAQLRTSGFGLRVRRNQTVVRSCAADGGDLVIRGSYVGRDRQPVLRLALDDGLDWAVTPEVTWADGRAEFVARVPAAELLAHPEHQDAVEELVAWNPHLLVDGEEQLLLFHPDCTEAAVRRGSRRLTATRTPYANLVLVESHAYPTVDHVAWTSRGTLECTGSTGLVQEVPERVLLRCYDLEGEPLDVWTDVTVDGDRFRFCVDVTRLPDLGRAATRWHLFAPAGTGRVPVVVARTAAGVVPAEQLVLGRCVRVEVGRAERLRVVVG